MDHFNRSLQWFARFADKEGLTNTELREIVNRLEAGQADADLGGGVVIMEKKYESEALMVSHQAAQDLYELGIIGSGKMREFDKICLVQESETAQQTERTPEAAQASRL